jgi:hypothetical protein
MNLEKIAAGDAAAVLARSSKVASALADENDELRRENTELRNKIASYERRDQVHKLASEMEDKGLNAGMTFEEKVASIDSCPDLSQVEQAIKMAGAGNIGLPSVTEDLNTRGDSQHSAHAFFVTGQSN